MKIEYIEHNAIDFEKWDNCIATAKNGMPYAYSWYLNLVSPNWNALITPDYSTVMPLTWQKKMGIHYIYQPFFTQQLGVFSINDLSSSIVHDFLCAVPNHFRYLDFYMNEKTPLPDLTCRYVRRVNYVLPLHKPYYDIHELYDNSTKRNLKKSLRSDFFISHNPNIDEIANLYQETISRKKTPLKQEQYDLLIQLLSTCQYHNMAEILGCYNHSKKIICALFLIKSHYRFINLISASNLEGRKHSLMFRLLDSIIQQHATTNYALDFEGSMVPSIASFYSGFGAEKRFYWHITQNKLPFPLNLLKK